MRTAVHLRIVRDEEEPLVREDAPSPARVPRGTDLGELALVAALFLLNLIPVACELAGLGRWSPSIVGFAAAALLLTGRELWSQLRALARARTDRTDPPERSTP